MSGNVPRDCLESVRVPERLAPEMSENQCANAFRPVLPTCLSLSEVVSCGTKRREGKAAPESEGLHAVDLDTAAVQGLRTRPVSARLVEVLGHLVDPWDEDQGPIDGSEDGNALVQVPVQAH